MKTIDAQTIRHFYQRLNHHPYGVTELAVIDPSGKGGMIATGFFNEEIAFVKACKVYNGRFNLYAGRNPRPSGFPKVCTNYLDVRYKQRAKDTDIEHMTAISLDIDPVRGKNTSSTESQHQAAIDFAKELQKQLGGCVDGSGNGAYLWIPFADSIQLTDQNREIIKQKCRKWQQSIVGTYQPETYGLRIDGCFDLSRLKKVIGTLSVKGKTHRLSRFVLKGEADKIQRQAILAMPQHRARKHRNDVVSLAQGPQSHPPEKFIKLLACNGTIRELWCTPDEANDTSMHDWRLGMACLSAGITTSQELAAVLMHNPFGKFRRDRRIDYLKTTVNNMVTQYIARLPLGKNAPQIMQKARSSAFNRQNPLHPPRLTADTPRNFPHHIVAQNG